MMDNFNISNFYVGRLSLESANNNLITKKENSLSWQDEFNKNLSLISSGAIKDNYVNDDIHSTKKYISLFYRIDNNSYLCLHNNSIYYSHNKNFCEDLIPMSQLLPKLGYSKPINLTFEDALNLFNKLFKKNHDFKYDNSVFDINDFYLATLNYCYADRLNIKSNVKHSKIHYNSDYSNYVLPSNYAKVQDHMIWKDKYFDYYYNVYKCLFLDLHHGGEMYNLNDYKVYSHVDVQSETKLCGNSFYHSPVALSEEIHNNSKEYNNNTISISNALKLQKKLTR